MAGQLAQSYNSPLLSSSTHSTVHPTTPHTVANPFSSTSSSTDISVGSHQLPPTAESRTLSPGTDSSGGADSTGLSCITSFGHGTAHATPSHHYELTQESKVQAEAAHLDRSWPQAPPPSLINNFAFTYSQPLHSGWPGNMGQIIVPEYEGQRNPPDSCPGRPATASYPLPPPSIQDGGELSQNDRCLPESNGGRSSTADRLVQAGAATGVCGCATEAVSPPGQVGVGPAMELPSDSKSSPAATDQAASAKDSGLGVSSDMTALDSIHIELKAKQVPMADPRRSEEENCHAAPDLKTGCAPGRGRHRDTTESRWKKACLRCRVQKLRVSFSS